MQRLATLGFIRVLATYDELADGRRRQTNNTYFILALPPTPEVRQRRRFFDARTEA